MASIVNDQKYVSQAKTYLTLFRLKLLTESVKTITTDPRKSEQTLALAQQIEVTVAGLESGDEFDKREDVNNQQTQEGGEF